MKLIEEVRLVGVNLAQNRFKVALTSLGIIIGTLTICLVIAIGKGGEEQILQQYSVLSAETIYVGLSPQAGDDTDDIDKLTPSDLEFAMKENPFLSSAYLRAMAFDEVGFPSGKESVALCAVTKGFEEVSGLHILEGSSLEDLDYGDARKNAVIGYDLATQNFKDPASAVGQTIRIGGSAHRVVGVLEKKSEGLQGLAPDTTVFLPFETATEMGILDGKSFPQIVGLALDVATVPKAMERLKSSVDYLMTDSESYQVENAGARIDAALESARTMSLLLVSVAAIVFLVGGIGIMNVLFLTVKERTREIGIWKAVGATRRDILLQFLLESIGIGLLGGIVGVALSAAALPLLARSGVAVAPSFEGQAIGLAFAVATAAAFGFYPAWRASRLDPVKALASE